MSRREPEETILGRALTPPEQEYARAKSIDDLHLSTRSVNALKILRCKTLYDVAVCPLRVLRLSKNVGAKTIDEITSTVRRGPEDYALLIEEEAERSRVESASRSSVGPDSCLGRELRPDEVKFSRAVPVAALGLSTRALNVLNRLGCRSALDVAMLSPRAILSAKGAGRKSAEEVSRRIVELMSKPSEVRMSVPLFISVPNEKQLREAYRLYQEHGTLKAVGKLMRLSRERIRQMLARGTRAGLFKYVANGRPPDISKEKLLTDYRRLGSIRLVAKENGLKPFQLIRQFRRHGVSSKQLASLREGFRRMKCADDFRAVAETLGHFPTATELQRMNGGRSLYARINHTWGSIDDLRDFLSIPRPPQGNPRFAEDVRRWREKRKHLDGLAMTQDKDAILQFLREAGADGNDG